jgi:uncharacterized protein (TIGR00369 family)
MTLDRNNPEQYPPNIQAILKRPAPAAVVLGQDILEVDAEKGFVRVAYLVAEQLANKFGAMHGGMTAAMIDDAMSLAAGVTAQWGEITPTLEMKVSYLAQAKPGMRLIAEARTVKRGRTVIFLECVLADETGKSVATGSCTVMVTAHKKS